MLMKLMKQVRNSASATAPGERELDVNHCSFRGAHRRAKQILLYLASAKHRSNTLNMSAHSSELE